MKKDIEGVIVPLITPLKDKTALDERGLARLIDYVVKGGVDSLFILGTTGEGPCLNSNIKNDLIVKTSKFLQGRIKNLVGITDTSPEESLKLSYLAADNGADAVVIAPPSYFPLTQDELVDYVQYIVEGSPLPVILYNIPRLTKTSFDIETIQRLTDEKGIIGFKDSSKDWKYFQEVLQITKTRPDWTVLTGAEELLVKSMEIGADGGVLGGANIIPKHIANFYQAIKNQDLNEISRLEDFLLNWRSIYTMGSGSTSSIQVLKYILEQKSICHRTMTLPFKDLDEDTGKMVSDIIASHFNNIQSVN